MSYTFVCKADPAVFWRGIERLIREEHTIIAGWESAASERNEKCSRCIQRDDKTLFAPYKDWSGSLNGD